jgi:hypothetical protein
VDLGTVLGKGTEWRTKDNIKFTYLWYNKERTWSLFWVPSTELQKALGISRLRVTFIIHSESSDHIWVYANQLIIREEMSNKEIKKSVITWSEFSVLTHSLTSRKGTRTGDWIQWYGQWVNQACLYNKTPIKKLRG